MKKVLIAAAMVALAAPAIAQASARNSIQPGRTFFHTVQSGTHPNKIATLHNGTGTPQTVETVAISGAGGYVFTLAANTAELANTDLPRCKPGLVLAPNARCAMDVRVHTVRVGWFRSVLRVVYTGGVFNSGQIEAHVVN